MAIFGRIAARQRLRRATRESLAIPAFSPSVDCTPWVIGGLWPAELSTITAENATLATYLRADLERIANRANDELRIVKRAGLDDPARRAQEAGVIGEARAHAAQRVESTIRQLHTTTTNPAAGHPRVAERSDPHKTQVIPAVADADLDGQARIPAQRRPVEDGRHVASPVEQTRVVPVVREVEPVVDAPAEGGLHAAASGGGEPSGAEVRSDIDRLSRLLEFVVRQEPRLHWAVGDHVDGTTVLATDLAHGWLPADIAVPEGVRLLAPERRTGKVSAWIADTVRMASYAPGDPLRRSADFTATKSSLQPRQLPAVENLGTVLSEATRRREGLPRIVYRLAAAVHAGTGVIDQEVDVLRVHLDTARYRLLTQYPAVDPVLLLNCQLLAATERITAGDAVSANYHLSWFQHLATTHE